MFSALRTRYGIPGVIATVALVFAMTGGAFAAKYLITSTKQISPSVLKKLKGATGPAGAAGAQGAQGAAGAAGAAGKDGAQGLEGKQGPKGEQGAKGEKGAQGIQGEKGEAGEDGETGFTATLPPGETETGFWATNLNGEGSARAAISLSIPLPTALTYENEEPPLAHVVYSGEEPPTECAGGSAADPKAIPGHVCVWMNPKGFAGEVQIIQVRPSVGFFGGVGKAGGEILLDTGNPGGSVSGTFAVTAPEP